MMPFSGFWVVVWLAFMFAGGVMGGWLGWREYEPDAERSQGLGDYVGVVVYVALGFVAGMLLYVLFPVVCIFAVVAALLFGASWSFRFIHKKVHRGHS